MLALSNTFEQLTCPIPAIAVLIGSRALGTNRETSDWDIAIWWLDNHAPWQQLGNTETLRRAILKKAFLGQLVAQDPNDESASELLARIQKSKTKRL